MKNLTVINSLKQYREYCNELERLVEDGDTSKQIEERIDLLTVLIEKWDEEHSVQPEVNPVDMLKHLMSLHGLTAYALAKKSGIDKTVLSRILNYKKGFSKEVIRILAEYFKVNQELFNKPYALEDIPKVKAPTISSKLTPIKRGQVIQPIFRDSLHIIPSKKTISMSVTTLELKSKDDNHIVLYVPSLKIFGKAADFSSAKEKLDEAATSLLKRLVKLTAPKLAVELRELGWKQDKIKTKNYSKSYVDQSGILQDFEIPVQKKIVNRSTELFAV